MSETKITEQQAEQLAEVVARREGWTWMRPIKAQLEFTPTSTRERRHYNWVVSAGIHCIDCGGSVTIDSETGQIIDGWFHGGRSLPVGLTMDHSDLASKTKR